MEEAIQFLIELRRRTLRYLLILGGVVIVALFYANDIYQWLALPLLRHLPNGTGIIAITIPAPFMIPFKSVFAFSLFITIPFLLYQLWRFVAPALYQAERKFLWPVLIASSGLFYLGVLFAYFVVLPMVFQFFIAVAPQGVEIKPDISQYYSFVLRLFFAFGFSFEVPVMVLLLCWSGICTVESLTRKRPYIIVAAFIVGMLLTPPDVISQILLAIPLWMLYELGLVLAKYLLPKQATIKEIRG